MIHLGVNIDHVATLRQVRHAVEPDPVWAAAICELAGAHNITVHLREDRRHIQDRDLDLLKKTARTKLNLEMANVSEIIEIALRIKPDQITLVPERRKELTTEGGLDVRKNIKPLKESVKKFANEPIEVGFFIDPDSQQVEASHEAGAYFVEFHTGRFASAHNEKDQDDELQNLIHSSETAYRLGLKVHAGHGLHYQNIHKIVKVPYLEEVNIGHAIISRSVFVGLENAVREMLNLIRFCSTASL
jgi:pyridoxine 5-phosphate synthase